MALSTLVTAGLVVGMVLLYVCWDHYVRKARPDPTVAAPLPPGSLGWPIIGESLTFVSAPIKMAYDHARRYGQIYKSHVFFKPLVVVGTADGLRTMLRASAEGDVVEAFTMGAAKALFGEGLSMQMGRAHHRARQLVGAAFTPAALEGYVPTFERQATRAAVEWASTSRPQSLFPAIQGLTMATALATLCSKDESVTEAHRRHLAGLFTDLIAAVFSIPVRLPFTTYSKGLRARKELVRVFSDMVRRRKAAAASGSATGPRDVLQRLVDARSPEGEELATAELADQALLLVFAGFDTTSATLFSVLRMLEAHPQVLQRVREEQQQLGLPMGFNAVTTSAEGSSQKLTYDVARRMHYLDAVIQETLRLVPSVAGNFRVAKRTFQVGGYQVPKGWLVLFSVALAHHTNQAQFDDPAQFRPERFLQSPTPPPQPQPQSQSPAAASRRRSAAEVAASGVAGAGGGGGTATARAPLKGPGRFGYIPFGAGRRTCIGKPFARTQLCVVLSVLCRSVTVTVKPNPPPMTYMPMPRPTNGGRATVAPWEPAAS